MVWWKVSWIAMTVLNFPTNPTNGQVYQNYYYDLPSLAWRSLSATTHPIPSTLNNATFKTSTTDGVPLTVMGIIAQTAKLQEWKNSSSTVVASIDNSGVISGSSLSLTSQISPSIGGTPTGAVISFAGSTAPSGYILCDGQDLSTTTYAALFSTIGYAYGGSGATFKVPNLKGKIPVGLDSSDTNFDILNTPTTYIGEKSHILSIAEVPIHSHTFSATTNITGSHNHINGWASITGYNYVGSGGNSTWPFGGGSNAAQRDLQSSGDHSHTVSGTTSNSGSSSAHNNVQPYIVLNYIIKT